MKLRAKIMNLEVFTKMIGLLELGRQGQNFLSRLGRREDNPLAHFYLNEEIRKGLRRLRKE